MDGFWIDWSWNWRRIVRFDICLGLLHRDDTQWCARGQRRRWLGAPKVLKMGLGCQISPLHHCLSWARHGRYTFRIVLLHVTRIEVIGEDIWSHLLNTAQFFFICLICHQLVNNDLHARAGVVVHLLCRLVQGWCVSCAGWCRGGASLVQVGAGVVRLLCRLVQGWCVSCAGWCRVFRLILCIMIELSLGTSLV